MFCPSCGTKNNYYHRFCFHCGARLSSELSETEQTQSEQLDLQSNDLQQAEPIPAQQDSILQQRPTRIPQDSAPQQRQSARMQQDSAMQQKTTRIPKDSALQQTGTDRDAQNPALLQVQPEKVPLAVAKRDEFNNDAYIAGLPDSEPDEEEFDIRNRMPLRRYHKNNGGDGLQTLVKVCISIVLIALIAFLCYVGYDQLFKDPAEPAEPVVKHIDLEYSVEEATADDGTTGRKVIILTTNGEQVSLLDQTVPVTDGRAEIILPDSGFSMQDYEQKDGALQVSLSLQVKADGYPDRQEEIHFEVPVNAAPLAILSPSGKEAVVDGSSYQLILEVQPGSEVFIDNNNYSHLINEQGQLSVQLEVPEQPETRYEIRVSAKGYEDAVDEIVLKKRQMEFPLDVNGAIPIQATEEEWVEITGNTHPEAVLTSNLEMREPPVLDPVTGDFKLYVKATAKGYTPFVLTASLEGKLDSVLELVISRTSNEQEYTSTAWAAVYDDLKNYPNLHNGNHYVFKGIVKEISSTGTKTTLLVDIADEGQPEQVICVDYWGQFTFSMGQKIRIFGNHWSNKKGVPYILAPYVYR